VAFIKTGYEPDGDKKIAEAVRKALPEAPAEKEKPAENPEKPEDAKSGPPPSGEPLLPAPKLN
jgi:hypothetical protein